MSKKLKKGNFAALAGQSVFYELAFFMAPYAINAAYFLRFHISRPPGSAGVPPASRLHACEL
jgi:hypothetical protein